MGGVSGNWWDDKVNKIKLYMALEWMLTLNMFCWKQSFTH
jgi:hypothetical protein